MSDKRSKIQAIFLYCDAQSSLYRFGLAVLAVTLAIIATQNIPVIGQRAVFLFFFFAIIQSGFWLGLYPGILAMLLSFISVNALVLLPIWVSKSQEALILNTGFGVLSAIFIATTNLHRSLTAALLKKQQDLDTAQTIGQSGNWRMDVLRNKLDWSDENHHIFGLPKGTPMTYETFLSTIHPEDRDYVDQKWQAALQGEPYDIEHRIIVADKVKWVRERAELEFDNKGKLLGGFGTTQDITDHKLIQQELLESQQQYAGIVGSAMDAIVTVDNNHTILVFNPAAEYMFGCTSDEVIGGSLHRFIPEELRHAHDVHITAFGRTDSQSRKMGRAGVVNGLRANGEEFPIEVTISQSGTGGAKLFTAILRDVTERIRAETTLQERENEIRLIMDATPALIAYLDTDFRYLRANKTYENWFCLHQEQILGHTAQEIIGEKAWGIVSPYIERARLGERVNFDYQIPYGTSKPRWVHGNYIPDKDANGNVKGVVVHVTDIENRKQVELERQKFVSLADNSQEFIGICDINFMPFYINAAGMRLVGIDSLEQALKTPVQEFFFPEDQAFIIEEFFPQVIIERRGEVEIRFRHFQTGAALWMIYNVFYITNDNGESVGLATVSRDITARKQSELALEESERKNRFLANILEHADQPFGVGYPDGRLEYVNPAFEQLTGFSRDELLAMDWVTELTPPEWRAIEQAKLEGLQQCDRAIRYEKEYYRKDGTRVPIELMVELVSNDAGQPIHYYAFITDLTERKRAEAALRKSEEQFRLATERHVHELQVYQTELEMQNEQLKQATIDLETSRSHYLELYDFAPVGYLTLNMENMVVEANLTAATLLEVPRNNLVNHRFTKFIEDSDKDLWYQLLMRVRQQDDKQSIELLLHKKDGHSFSVHIDCLYKPANHNSGQLRIALVDITERKRAEKELLSIQARLALVVEEVKAGYWDWDLATNKLYLSPEWNRQLGLDEEESLIEWDRKNDRLHPDDQTLVAAATENYLAGRQPNFELQFRLRHKNGTYRWIHSRGALLRDQHNRPYRMLGLNLDITDYMREKELNERRGEMEKSFQLYIATQTAAAIAHELNQPLTAISYYAYVAQDALKAGNQNPQKLAKVMEKCAEQAQRAGAVIQQLLAILHKGETISEPVDINQSVNYALDLVKAQGNLKAYIIELNLAADIPMVTANALQVQKVLVNLLNNGLESMRESERSTGTVTVASCLSPNNPALVLVSVCDSGMGVPDSDSLKKIFEPFYTTKTTGLGMGLAISRALIEAHGGKMWAEQNANFGISVHFTLPIVL